MSMKAKEIWVFAEIADGEPVPVYQELLCKAKELANKMGETRVCSVVLGHAVDGIAEKLTKMGGDVVYSVDHEKLSDYNSDNYACAMEHLIRTYAPEMVLVGATAIGSELAPTVAAKLKTGLAAHCVDIRLDGERVNCMVPAFGGRVVSEIYIPDTKPMMASVRPGILNAEELPANSAAERITVDPQFADQIVVREERISFEANTFTGKKLEESEVVVCAGRGVMNGNTWANLQLLAEKLDAGIGYTRSFADTGLVPDESNMIGTSGKSVKPKVFLGFGISGAAHHVCGMNKSGLVITVNKDEKAKMFRFSDIGAVGDADKVLTALLEKLD